MSSYCQAGRPWRAVHEIPVDDRGECSFASLKPGTYYLAARGAPLSGDRATYYPGATQMWRGRVRCFSKPASMCVRDANRVRSGGAGRRQHHSCGRADSPAGFLYQCDSDKLGRRRLHGQHAVWLGVPRPYELKGVSPGNYTVVVATRAPGEDAMDAASEYLRGILRVEVGGSDIGNLDVQLQELPRSREPSVLPRAARRRRYGYTADLARPPAPNGSFVLSGIPPGHFM